MPATHTHGHAQACTHHLQHAVHRHAHAMHSTQCTCRGQHTMHAPHTSHVYTHMSTHVHVYALLAPTCSPPAVGGLSHPAVSHLPRLFHNEQDAAKAERLPESGLGVRSYILLSGAVPPAGPAPPVLRVSWGDTPSRTVFLQNGLRALLGFSPCSPPFPRFLRRGCAALIVLGENVQPVNVSPHGNPEITNSLLWEVTREMAPFPRPPDRLA